MIFPNDGVKRTKAEAERVASAFAATFQSPSGKEVLKHLRNMTVNRVMPNSSTSNALWHLEGSRHIFMVIEQWVSAGRSKGERNE